LEAKENVCGRVALAHRKQYVIWTECGEIEATLSGRLRASQQGLPCVGDWVLLREGGVIVEILPRRTKLSRKEPGNAVREQVLAANIDVLFLVSGLDQDYNLRRIERYLVVARESGARAIVLLNKADLQIEVEDWIRRTEERLGSLPVIAMSARTGWGLGRVRAQVQSGETAALIGSSGVGKSTIVNALLDESRQDTAPVREHDQRGRHTTSRRELFLMPGNWFLIDMPGLREVKPWAGAEQVDEAFRGVAELAKECRFRDCRHESEPGCAVLGAGLDPDHLQAYRKIRKEQAFLEREANPHRARAERQRWKAIEKAQRKAYKSR
jgi:ribosome biogenesis GTPase